MEAKSEGSWACCRHRYYSPLLGGRNAIYCYERYLRWWQPSDKMCETGARLFSGAEVFLAASK